MLRAWLIYHTTKSEHRDRAAPLEFFANLRVDDLMTFPVYLLHFFVILLFLIFADYVAYMPFFGRDWFALQLTTMDGYAGDGINVTLSNQTLADPDAMFALRMRINETAHTVSTYTGINNTIDTEITTELFIRWVLLVNATFEEADKKLLSPMAALHLEEWVRASHPSPSKQDPPSRARTLSHGGSIQRPPTASQGLPPIPRATIKSARMAPTVTE